MINLKHFTDDQLHESGIKAVKEESKAGISTMNHIIEVNRRHLYSKYDCSSLHDYCVRHWKMSNGDAWRKISAVRLVNEEPELELKLKEGILTQTHLADASVFFKKENFTREQKTEALKEIENTSTEKAKSILLSKSKTPEKHLKDRVKQKTSSLTEVTLYLDEEAMKDFARLKEIWSNAIPTCELSKIAKRAIKEAIENHDPAKRDEKREYKMKTPVTGSRAEIKYQVRKRDRYQCTYIDERTGESCQAKHFLEEDHVVPKAKGGDYTVENLRLRCRTHNQRHAINTYGLKKMRVYIDALHPAQPTHEHIV